MGRLQTIIGTEIVDDIRLGHTWHELDVLKNFIQSNQPKRFVEIGIHEGGLSYLLIPVLSCDYIGVELNCSVIRPAVGAIYAQHHERATLWCGDCFSDELYTWLSSLEGKIIYCDGGNKPKELKHFKSACFSGDIIMTHDFHDGIRAVKTVPPEHVHPEVTLADIEHMEKDNMFIRLPEELFCETRIVGWMAK